MALDPAPSAKQRLSARRALVCVPQHRLHRRELAVDEDAHVVDPVRRGEVLDAAAALLAAVASPAGKQQADTAAGDAELDRHPVMGSGELNWFQFLLIMTAHGWFLRPRAFPLLRDGSKDTVTPRQAMRRVWLFVGLWVASIAAFPIHHVALAFGLWVVLLTPGLIEIHRQFQNEPDPY